jgi:hypothetical protein
LKLEAHPRLNVRGFSKLFPENSPPFPEWLADYIEFHRNSLKLDNKGNYRVKKEIPTLKLVGKSGGVGDRMNSAVGEIYLAICHGRGIY